MLNLNEKELGIILNWYYTADVYYSERGIEAFKEDEELRDKIQSHMRNPSS